MPTSALGMLLIRTLYSKASLNLFECVHANADVPHCLVHFFQLVKKFAPLLWMGPAFTQPLMIFFDRMHSHCVALKCEGHLYARVTQKDKVDE